jgi:DNA polymerase zeta
LFVLLEGATREEAFLIGQQIADKVTSMNPSPVKLQFEKVYHPCVLVSKKRYVGFKYESPTQKEPIFDAKGIETVRRDTCPAVSKIMEKSLRLLFSKRDLSLVKEYLQEQWMKILNGTVSLSDFIFAKEVRLGTYR